MAGFAHRRRRALRSALQVRGAAMIAALVAPVVLLVGLQLAADPADAAPGAPHRDTVVAQVEANPSSDGFPGGQMMQKLLNWAMQFGLWGSLASLLIGGGIWGVSKQFGNGQYTGKGGMLAAAGAIGAVITGLGPTIVNTMFNAAKG